ncbi:MAG: glycosyltransferase family 2 protein, partial [Chloroflexota bacterium]
ADPRLDRLYRYVTLETGLVVGSAILSVGVIGSLYAVGVWQAQAFGPLAAAQTERTLRIVIVSGSAIALGLETILASFFLSVLGLRRR